MHLFGMRAEIFDPPRDAVIKARADVDHHIAAVHGQIGLIQAVHPQHPQPVLARSRVRPKPHKGRGDREIRFRHQIAQQNRCRAARVDNPAAGIEHGAFGGFDQVNQLGNQRFIPALAGLIMRDFGRFARGIVGGGELHILGNVDQHRAGAAVGCDMKGLVQRFSQFGGVFDQPVHLGAGAGDAHGIRLLEAICADHKGRHLA